METLMGEKIKEDDKDKENLLRKIKNKYFS